MKRTAIRMLGANIRMSGWSRRRGAKIIETIAGDARGWLAASIRAGMLLTLALPLPGHAEKSQSGVVSTHGIAMHGKPALPAGFSHFPYVNPSAPKGGRLRLGRLGTFDSLNPYNLKAGSSARGLSGNVYQSLLTRSRDEPFTLYGLIAESIETNASRSVVTFRLNKLAKFSDGRPLTSADVRFSVDLLRKHGRPQHRAALSRVKSLKTPDARTVIFDISDANDRELPLILGLIPILPAHATDVKNFPDSSLKIPIGSGPYILRSIKPGLSLHFERNKNYWAKDLAVSRGFYNFDYIDIEYFRDASTLFQALKAGIIDYLEENNPTNWRTGYDFAAIRDGRVIKKSLPLGGVKGIHGFAFNIRRDVFSDVRVREALAMMFDFEWLNTNIYGGLFRRTKSFFDNSKLSAAHRPAEEKEIELLARWPDAVRKDILDGTWRIPVHDGSGRDRSIARRAIGLLAKAGYRIRSGVQTHKTSGKPLAFEILVSNLEQERQALIFGQALKRIGVTVKVRQTDLVQYQRRRQKFDFDMIMGWWIASNSPGNEQRNRWSSKAANVESSFNLVGVKSAAVDGLIREIVAAKNRSDFVAAVRAFDRVLLSGFYIVPFFHKPDLWMAYSAKLKYPARFPKYSSPFFGETLDTWWSSAK